ncbi:hypothetical protein BC941DRAFT_474671 [Chlamydoabsidia padenii]|nr:hypothetical protein BC941DRAFT_474671 [Chlamydoabsidia padenii]
MLTPRRWKGNDGKFEAHATFISVYQKTKVKLQKVNGGVIAVPLERLSPPDIDYLISLFGLDEWNKLTNPPIVHSPPHNAMIPTPTSSLKRAQYQPNFAPPTTRPRSFMQLPGSIVSRIGYWLDVRSRLALSRTCRHICAVVMVRDAWHFINLDQPDQLDDHAFQQLTRLLLRYQLHYAPRQVILDHTLITAHSIGYLIHYFPSMRYLSFRSCPAMDYHHLATTLDTLTCRSEVTMVKMISTKTIMHGSDIRTIHGALERLTGRAVDMDCDVCDQCQVSACTPTLTCLGCGVVALKRCKACSPACDQCHGRLCDACGGLARSDCGRCDQPVFLCPRPSCQVRGCAIHGLFHARCKKSVPNTCTACGEMACPVCDLSRCGGGCRRQWCSRCVQSVDLVHCKCILIHGVVGSTMSKRTICRQCKKECPNCQSVFCHRCLDLHQQGCLESTRNKKTSRKHK